MDETPVFVLGVSLIYTKNFFIGKRSIAVWQFTNV